jgi:hypothetical protein
MKKYNEYKCIFSSFRKRKKKTDNIFDQEPMVQHNATKLSENILGFHDLFEIIYYCLDSSNSKTMPKNWDVTVCSDRERDFTAGC